MAEPKVDQNQATTEPKGSRETSPQTGEPTTEYILLDQVFTKQVGKRGKKYKKGSRVPLTEAEAVTLLAGPRPSVREVTKEDNEAQ